MIAQWLLAKAWVVADVSHRIVVVFVVVLLLYLLLGHRIVVVVVVVVVVHLLLLGHRMLLLSKRLLRLCGLPQKKTTLYSVFSVTKKK